MDHEYSSTVCELTMSRGYASYWIQHGASGGIHCPLADAAATEGVCKQVVQTDARTCMFRPCAFLVEM